MVYQLDLCKGWRPRSPTWAVSRAYMTHSKREPGRQSSGGLPWLATLTHDITRPPGGAGAWYLLDLPHADLPLAGFYLSFRRNKR